MATMLTKTETTFMVAENLPDGGAVFEQVLDKDGFMPRPIRSIFLTKAVVEELGSPDLINVTIESHRSRKENT